nr:hypothetical protein Ade03nite_33820 [Actinoplanes derwentensis]
MIEHGNLPSDSLPPGGNCWDGVVAGILFVQVSGICNVGACVRESADKVDGALEASRDGMRALWISLAVLGVTAAVQAGIVV